MHSYRLYFLDEQDNRIKAFREFEAKHDLAALLKADGMRGDAPMELWCGVRKVEEWPARTHLLEGFGNREQSGNVSMQ
jgi:hypothetical protein